MKSICSSVRSIFSFSDPVKEFGLTGRPSLLLSFVKDVLHADKCQYFFKLMWDSSASKDTRDSIGRTVARALVKAIKVVGVCKQDALRRDLAIVAELR